MNFCDCYIACWYENCSEEGFIFPPLAFSFFILHTVDEYARKFVVPTVVYLKFQFAITAYNKKRLFQ